MLIGLIIDSGVSATCCRFLAAHTSSACAERLTCKMWQKTETCCACRTSFENTPDSLLQMASARNLTFACSAAFPSMQQAQPIAIICLLQALLNALPCACGAAMT